MMELAQIRQQLDRIEAMLAAMATKPQPHLTRVQFAKLAGISAKTVSRKIAARSIRTERGRIPCSELAKFTSRS